MGILSKLRHLYRSWTGPQLPEPESYLPNAASLEKLRQKSVLTQREELILAMAVDRKGSPAGAYRQERAESMEDANGTLYFALPDSPRHEARLQPAVKGDYDRIFWANLIIACDGP